MAKKMMPISSRWFQGAVVTYLLGFTVLGILALFGVPRSAAITRTGRGR